MNERIKELAEHARKYARGQVAECKHYGYYTESLDDVYETEFEEKFAEMIVRECAELTLDYKNEAHYNGWLDHCDAIKKHFGVEE